MSSGKEPTTLVIVKGHDSVVDVYTPYVPQDAIGLLRIGVVPYETQSQRSGDLNRLGHDRG